MEVAQLARGEEALRKIKRLKPTILEHREEGNIIRHLPDALAEAFLAADLFRVDVPIDLGGGGHDPMVLVDLVEEMSSYDASVGWNFGIMSGGSAMCGGLPLSRLREIFGDPDCSVAGSALLGRAVVTDGGYIVSGRWGWGSGIHHARWVVGQAAIFDADRPRLDKNGMQETRFFLFPKIRVKILDTWFSGGMRGTGSTDWEVSGLFVPLTDSFKPFSGESEHSAPIFRLPGTYFGLTFCACALGAARSSIEGLEELAAQSGSTLKDQSQVQFAIAKAQALHESSHLNVRESVQVLWDNVCAGRSHTLAQRSRARRSYVHAVDSALEAATLCSQAAGGAAVFEKWPFARALRDLHTIQGHVALSRRFMEMAGQAILGLPVLFPIF